MSWTDERVATLTKLWSQGKSASEIAEVLGGVTRNAVIGKAHRLGLSGRPSPIKKKKVTKKTTAKKKKPTETKATKETKTKKAAETKKPAKPARKEIKLPIAPPTFIEEKPVHDGELISILDLTERVCRWPIGDPKEGEFGFCGAECHDPAHPYCLPHMAMAFQASSKKDSKKMVKNTKTSGSDDNEIDDEEDIEDIDLENFDPDDIENDDDDEDFDDLDENNEELTVATVAPTK